MQRWTEYFSNLLTRPPAVISEDLCLAASSSVPNPEICTDPPTLLEINQAVARMKLRKAPGCCSISAEMLLSGGESVTKSLRCLCAKIWESEQVPADWKKGIVVPIYKGKGSRSECNSFRGITLRFLPGKVLARTQQCSRRDFVNHVAYKFLPSY